MAMVFQRKDRLLYTFLSPFQRGNAAIWLTVGRAAAKGNSLTIDEEFDRHVCFKFKAPLNAFVLLARAETIIIQSIYLYNSVLTRVIILKCLKML